MLTEAQEEADNLRNELSTLNDEGGDLQRVSIEGIKMTQLERDISKLKQHKINLENSLQQAQETIEQLEA